MISWENGALLVGASALAGAINSVAGGGTLLTFPALTFGAGVSAIVANATSTVALWPGQLSSLWGYRMEIQQNARAIVPLTTIGVAGGAVGALLLLHTSSALFDHLVPFLVLGATAIFGAQEPLARWQKRRAAVAEPAADGAAGDGSSGGDATALRLTLPIALFLFGVAVYGGYFGAGIGILTLAAFGLLGMTNIHQMNGIKAIFTLWINGIAAILFMAERLVDWRIAAIMAVGAIVGGYAGAGVARRIGQKNVRRVVIGIGLGLTASLLYKLLR
jgi:hypothetical protein